jgi:hypothetical protein
LEIVYGKDRGQIFFLVLPLHNLSFSLSLVAGKCRNNSTCEENMLSCFPFNASLIFHVHQSCSYHKAMNFNTCALANLPTQHPITTQPTKCPITASPTKYPITAVCEFVNFYDNFWKKNVRDLTKCCVLYLLHLGSHKKPATWSPIKKRGQSIH